MELLLQLRQIIGARHDLSIGAADEPPRTSVSSFRLDLLIQCFTFFEAGVSLNDPFDQRSDVRNQTGVFLNHVAKHLNGVCMIAGLDLLLGELELRELCGMDDETRESFQTWLVNGSETDPVVTGQLN